MVLHKTLLKSHDFKDVAKGLRLIIVFNSSKGKMMQFLATKAGSEKDEFGIPIVWDLHYYTKAGLFSSVHTWDISQFKTQMGAIGL